MKIVTAVLCKEKNYCLEKEMHKVSIILYKIYVGTMYFNQLFIELSLKVFYKTKRVKPL